MNKQLETAAGILGIKIYTENGRLKMEAKRAGQIIKAWAFAGFDVQAVGGKSVKEWIINDQSGAYIGMVIAVEGFAYSFTTKV